MKKYINTDEANKLFTFILGERSNGKCAVEKELVKKAKILKDLKKSLFEMYESVTTALYDSKQITEKAYLRGCQDCIANIKWIIDKGEHYEN